MFSAGYGVRRALALGFQLVVIRSDREIHFRMGVQNSGVTGVQRGVAHGDGSVRGGDAAMAGSTCGGAGKIRACRGVLRGPKTGLSNMVLGGQLSVGLMRRE